MRLQEAQELAVLALREHGLSEQGWRFSFDRSHRRFGHCRFRERVITLSRALVELNDFGEVWNTIMHEVAHALVGVSGHGAAWRMIAERIGGPGAACTYYAGAKARAAGRNVITPLRAKNTPPRSATLSWRP